MKLNALAELLEYKDTRSVLNWCKKNNISIVNAGKARYVSATQVDMFFEQQLNKAGVSQDLVNALRKDGSAGYKSVDIRKRSKAAQDLLRNLGMA